MFCMQCGTELPEQAKFCYQCGNPVDVHSGVPEEKVDRNDISNQKREYQSYFNKRDELSTFLDVDSFRMRDYREYVYFDLPEYIVSGKGNRNGGGYDEVKLMGRFHKETGKKELLYKHTDYIFCYTIFDDVLYFCKKNEDDYDRYDVLGINLQSRKIKRVARLSSEPQLILKNKSGSLIFCAYTDEQECCIFNAKNKMQVLHGMSDWDAGLIGYNECYIYYDTFPSNTYYCVDIDTFAITNIDTEIEKVTSDFEVSKIDCRTDIIYGKKDTKTITAIDWQNKTSWEIVVPDLSREKEKGLNPSNLFFNGEYWICNLNPTSDNSPSRDTGIGIACYDQKGKEIGRCIWEYNGYYEGYRVVFVFGNVMCSYCEIRELDTDQLITSQSRGNFDRIYRLFYLKRNKVIVGNKIFQERYC